MKLLKSYKFYIYVLTVIAAVAVIVSYLTNFTSAWLTDTNETTEIIDAEYTIGILDFDLTDITEQQININNIILKGGTKIYLKSDHTPEDIHFNDVVTPVQIRITNTGNIPMKISASYILPEVETTGIRYMLLQPSTNISGVGDAVFDYRNLILTNLEKTNSVGLNIYPDLDTYNATMFGNIRAVQTVAAGDALVFQVLLWADYDYLETNDSISGTNYLEKTISLLFKINATQAGGSAPDPEIVS